MFLPQEDGIAIQSLSSEMMRENIDKINLNLISEMPQSTFLLKNEIGEEFERLHHIAPESCSLFSLFSQK